MKLCVNSSMKYILALVDDVLPVHIDIGPQVVLRIDVLPNAGFVELVRDVDGVCWDLHDVPVGQRDRQVAGRAHAEGTQVLLRYDRKNVCWCSKRNS